MPEPTGDLIAQLFGSRDALENIAATRSKLLHEKAGVDSQLQVGVRAQIQILSQGAALLAQARGRISRARSTIKDMQETHRSASEGVSDFERIQDLSMVLANFDQTQRFVDHFRTFQQDIRTLRDLMDEDLRENEMFEIEMPMRNLIPVHYNLDRLRSIQEEAQTHLRHPDVTQDTKATVRKLYEPLDALVSRFDFTLFDIVSALLEILRTGDASLVVRVAKIIDFEERRDLVARLGQTKGQGMQASSTNAVSVTTAQQRPQAERGYPERFFARIDKGVKETFDNCMEQFPPDTDTEELLANLDWIYQDLAAAREFLVPCVPARWNIFEKFVGYYHAQLYRLIETVMRFDPPAQTLLILLQTVKTHYTTMKKEFGVPRKQLQPALLDGRENDIYDEYLRMLVAKLKEWYRTIAIAEQRPFCERTGPPDVLPDGALGLEGHTDMSKLVSQQLDVAADSGQGRIVAGCVDACCDVLTQRQQDWIRVLNKEVQSEINQHTAEGEEVPAGLFEYILALANDQDRAYSFLEELSTKWSEPLSKKYKDPVVSRFQEAQQGYQDVLKVCFQGIMRIIFTDASRAFAILFVDDQWYKGTTTQVIIDTLADFASEAQGALLPDLFDIFMYRLCAHTVLQYLKSLDNAAGKLKVPKGKERIQLDVQALFDFFVREDYGMDSVDIEELFHVFGPLIDALDKPVEQLTEPFEELRRMFWDAPLDLYECMVGVRRDLDVKSFKSVMAAVRSIAVSTKAPEGQEEHTFLHEFRR